MSETGIGHPSAVCMFPNDQAKCCAHDLAGNGWEWCRTKWRKDYQGYERSLDDSLAGADLRVLRGGSWFNVAGNARFAYRARDEPGSRDWFMGLRVVASPFCSEL